MSTNPGRRTLCALFCAVCFLLPTSAVRAGMRGQPRPPADVVVQIRDWTKDILGTGDLGTARPGLYLLVEKHATADLTDLLAAVLRDETTYQGLVATFEEALPGKTDDDARFLQYNLARLHLLRSRIAERSAALARASRWADRLGQSSPRDAAALELIGDIHAERGNLEAALAAYSRLATVGLPGGAAYAQLKIGAMYQRQSRPADAEAAYERGIRADAASGKPRGENLHLLYQALASLYLDRNNEAGALDALVRSARVRQDPDTPYRLRLEVAQRLLRERGRAREVLAYAEAALRHAPDDAAARALRDQARRRR